MIFAPGEVHELAPVEGRGVWHFQTLYLDGHAIAELHGEADLRLPGTFEARSPTLFAGLRRLHASVRADAPILDQDAHLVALLAGLAAESSPRSASADASRRPLEHVRDFLESCPDASTSLTDLATLSGLSPAHLSRQFRRVYGLPPHAYLTQARVNRARTLIRQGVPIIEAAARTGFADQAHLTRVFNRLVGTTPGRYRNSA